MIIIRGNETQSLPNQTGLPNRQYAGEGSALSAAGPAVANTANKGVALAVQLDDHYKRVEGIQAGKRIHSTLRDWASKQWQDWDEKVVKAGVDPTKAEEDFESRFADIRESDEYAAESDNPYYNEARQTAFEDIHADVMSKARPYARSTYLDMGRSKLDTQLEIDKTQALQAAASGKMDDYERIFNGSLKHITDLKGSLLNDAETFRPNSPRKPWPAILSNSLRHITQASTRR